MRMFSDHSGTANTKLCSNRTICDEVIAKRRYRIFSTPTQASARGSRNVVRGVVDEWSKCDPITHMICA
jgi:hypothetical protein